MTFNGSMSFPIAYSLSEMQQARFLRQRTSRMVRNEEEDGPVLERSTPVPRPQPYSIPPTSEEAQEMENILLAIRSRAVANVKGLKKTFSSSSKREQAPYTVKELYEALQQAVTVNAEAGVIFILCHRLVNDHSYDLNYSRRATTNLVKRMKNADSQDQRGNLLQIVAQNQRPDLAHILGFYADQISLDETLPIALANNNKDITSLLLGFGADASSCQAAFNEFGRKGDADMIKLLLGASRRPANIAQCLLYAVRSASLRSVLLLSGQMSAAGFSEQVDSALQHAVEINRDDIVHALMIGTHPPSGSCLNRAIEIVFAEVSVDLNEKMKMVKLLLWGGPEGNQVDEALVKATTRGCTQMMKLLLDGRASIDHRRGAAVCHSIRRSRDDLLDILLKDENLATDIASEAIGEIDHNAPSDLKCAIASKLLTQGASGQRTNELLIHAVQYRDLGLARILVRNGADVNYDEAKGLKIATSDRLVDILKIMLAGHPNNQSLLLAFKAIPMMDRGYRYLASKALLQAGATGPDIDNAFISALELPEDNKELIELFVDYVSDTAIARSILPVVKILDRVARFRTVNMILLRAVQKSIGAVEISQSVVETLQRYPDDMHLLDLLCQEGRADPNYNNGQALVLGIQQETKIFDRLLTKSVILFSPYSIACGLRAAIQYHGGRSRHHIVRALLCRIPRQNSSDQRLLDVISQGVIDVLRDSTNDIVLLHLLCIEGRADCNFLKGNAVAMAITCENQEVFDTVITSCSTLLPETVGMGLGLAMATISQARPTRIATLLSKNPPQDTKDSALVTEIEEYLRARQDYKVVKLLLDAGANINALDSKSMRLSVKDEVLMDMLLGHSPSQQSLSKAFRLAVALPERVERINRCAKLLRAGKIGKDVDVVFCKYAEITPIDIPFMELLLPQADVDFKNGLGLRNAIRGKQYQAVGLMLTKKPQSGTLQSAVQEAMQLKPQDERIRFMEMLLNAEARGEYLSDALITAIDDGDKILMERLLTCGASLEHQGGRSIENAAKSGSIEILGSIISGDFCSKPNLVTLTKGFVAAAAMRHNEALYYTMAEMFLNAGTKGEVVDQALIEGVRQGDSHVRLTELLLKGGASIEHQEGQAICIAAGNPHLQTLNILLKQGPSEKVLSQAFNAGMQLAADIRFPTIESIMKANKACDTHVSRAFSQAAEENPADQRLLNFLLSYDIFDEGEAMKHAASAFDHETMSTLVKAPQARHYLSGTMKFLMNRKDIWKSEQAVFVAKDLLEAGASGRAVNEALFLAVEKCETDNPSIADNFLDLLLQFQADVDYRRGLILQTAFQNGNMVVARKLLPHASDQTKMMASPYILASDPAFNEESVIELIKYISGPSHLFQDWSDFGHPDIALEPMLFMALRKYPNNCRILKVLLDVGISPNESIVSVLDSRIGDETTPVLCWAVMQPLETIRGDMISLLIDYGANANFRSTSNITPLMLAVRHQRSDVVEKLVTVKANIGDIDRDELSALNMASALGNDDIINELARFASTMNDGSLHDAARNLHCDSIRLLIKWGHEVDFPSDRHGGRSVLAELCSRAKYDGQSFPFEECIACLIGNGASLELLSNNKSIFHYAFDSVNPVPVVRALLKFLWKSINNDEYIYEDPRSNLRYSLTKYIEKGLSQIPLDQQDQVLQILRGKQAKDRFWANSVHDEQPADMIGAPQFILDEIQRRHIVEKERQDQEDKIRFQINLKRIAATEEDAIRDQQNQRELARQNQLAQTQRLLRDQEEEQVRRNEKLAADERLRSQQAQYRLEFDHQRAVASQNIQQLRAIEAEKLRGQLALEDGKNKGTKQRLQIENEAYGERSRIERDALQERLRMQNDNKMQQLQLEMSHHKEKLAIEDVSIKRRNSDLMAKQIEFARRFGNNGSPSSPRQRQLTNWDALDES